MIMRSERSFFGSPALKAHNVGTTRTRTPAQTMAVLEPVLSSYGITRLANVTGLDRIGIPVYQAIRPNSRSLSVSQGKGLDSTSAKVSALMESLETYHAENAVYVRAESYSALSRHARVADPTQLQLSRTSTFHVDGVLPWSDGWDLVRAEPVFVPFELVHTNATLPLVEGSGAFVPSSNGLASGNHMTEAALHGICELIERDAETLWRLGGERTTAETRVSPDSVECEQACRLLEQYRRAGIGVMIWDVTSDVQVACFVVVIFDPESDPELNPCCAASGSGCHPDRGIALCRALTEAAQSRLTSIAGSRDDITIGSHRRFRSAQSLEYHKRLMDVHGVRDFNNVPHAVGSTLDDDLNYVLHRLAERGMDQAIIVNLSSPELDLAFARAVVPGLEGSIDLSTYRPRARARARLA